MFSSNLNRTYTKRKNRIKKVTKTVTYYLKKPMICKYTKEYKRRKIILLCLCGQNSVEPADCRINYSVFVRTVDLDGCY